MSNPAATAASGATQTPIDEHTFSAERYFATQSPPPNLEETLQDVKKFVTANRLNGRRIVLVTVRFTRSTMSMSFLFFSSIYSYDLLLMRTNTLRPYLKFIVGWNNCTA
jgi:hypothetical protein